MKKKEKIIILENGNHTLFLEEYYHEHTQRIYDILDKEIGENMGWELRNCTKDLEKYLDNENLKFWSIFFDGRLIGGVFLDLTIKETNVWLRKMANLGYFIDKPYRGRGYISIIIPWIITHSFNILGLERIKVGHLENNIVSKKVIERNGFKLIGMERNYAKPLSSDRYLNHYVYDLIPEDLTTKENNFMHVKIIKSFSKFW
jgi:RimJ/RimL family protein N-acetyltransferase